MQPVMNKRLPRIQLYVLLIILFFSTSAVLAGGKDEQGMSLGNILPLWSALPFVGILLSIALMPLLTPHFWHHHFPKVSAAWALIFALPFLFVYRGQAWYEIAHIYIVDYFPFIILLWGLYTIAGGIFVRGTLKGTPAVNVLIILVGTMLASWVGTTGAAMITIRPLLRANAERKYKAHLVIFFIFLVANIGGVLTPLGDPPLFLGFLHGVSFFWTLKLYPELLFLVAALSIIIYIWDTILYKKEVRMVTLAESREPLKIEGAHNFIFLLGVVAAVLFSGLVGLGDVTVLGVHRTVQSLIRDGWIILMGILSLVLTRKSTRKANEFTWAPIKEVAYLFAGIFMTIIPALAILQAGEHGAMAALIRSVDSPRQFFFMSGALSSFLDNAPTYLTFFNTALGKLGLTENIIREAFAAGTLGTAHPEFESLIKGVSLGAVFMGANTYIGNAPNFMVKSIAEEAGIPMPSFFGYMFKYSIVVLIPLFILVAWLFL
jgi:Na+/H+ antiporter NhaD/arsenite permease-like protein